MQTSTSRSVAGSPPRHGGSQAFVSAGVPSTAKIDVERVVWPFEGQGVWAYRPCDRPLAVDVRAYVRADEERAALRTRLELLVELRRGRVFRPIPARDPRLRCCGCGSEGRRGVLKTGNLKLFRRSAMLSERQTHFRLNRLRRLRKVCAFHHWLCDSFFRDPFGLGGFHDSLEPPQSRQDRTVSAHSFFFPRQIDISLPILPAHGASGDICKHEFTHSVVHRMRVSTTSSPRRSRAASTGLPPTTPRRPLNDPRFGDWCRQPIGPTWTTRRCGLRPSANPQIATRWAPHGALSGLPQLIGRGRRCIAFQLLQFLMPRARTKPTARLCPADPPCFRAPEGRHKAQIDKLRWRMA